jgi:cystathionine beta-lyase/cystathionine gamma-synthase
MKTNDLGRNTNESFDEIGDIAALQKLQKRIYFAVDNTFATPYLQKTI